jgi:hypothetical protein
MFIAVLAEVAASAVNSNIAINVCSDNCGGQGEKNHNTCLPTGCNERSNTSVTQKYLALCHIQNQGDIHDI